MSVSIHGQTFKVGINCYNGTRNFRNRGFFIIIIIIFFFKLSTSKLTNVLIFLLASSYDPSHTRTTEIYEYPRIVGCHFLIDYIRIFSLIAYLLCDLQTILIKYRRSHLHNYAQQKQHARTYYEKPVKQV